MSPSGLTPVSAGLARPEPVTAAHLGRNAYLYVRQSTVRQVFENTESTHRQYALRQRALALGWPPEQIVVIDCDLGHSGAQAADRQGFQQLVAEVGLGKAGIVMGLEVSRLARNSADWHRLLEICALTETLILDEDGLYDPGHFNDRLLLGLKGTMSEAELHVLQARLRGGVLSKARRGELWLPPPVGLVYDPQGQLGLDPDQQVQAALRLLFATFQRTGSASATVKEFHRRGLQFPRRLLRGPQAGELIWLPLRHTGVLQALHNPRYAGAFVYGRVRVRRGLNGHYFHRRQPQTEWTVLLPQSHPGYLTWEEYQANQQRLLANAQSRGPDRHASPPREGTALLQGLVICGRCGNRMQVHYHDTRGPTSTAEYVCQRRHLERGEPICQRLRDQRLDPLVGQLLLDTVTPLTLEVALQVQEELQARVTEAEQLRQQQVERARAEADLARRRYLSVAPENRLVADTLETDWNARLRALHQAQEEYQRQQQRQMGPLLPEQQTAILALAQDFPRLWQSPLTPHRERKRMLRLLVEDITLLRLPHEVQLQVRFKGGSTTTLRLPPPPRAKRYPCSPPTVVTRLDQLLDQLPYDAVADRLNDEGLCSPAGHPFDAAEVQRLRRAHHLRSRYQRLRAQGLLTGPELARRLGVSLPTVIHWRQHGLLQALPCDAKTKYLYEPPPADPPVRNQGRRLRDRLQSPLYRQATEV